MRYGRPGQAPLCITIWPACGPCGPTSRRFSRETPVAVPYCKDCQHNKPLILRGQKCACVPVCVSECACVRACPSGRRFSRPCPAVCRTNVKKGRPQQDKSKARPIDILSAIPRPGGQARQARHRGPSPVGLYTGTGSRLDSLLMLRCVSPLSRIVIRRRRKFWRPRSGLAWPQSQRHPAAGWFIPV